MKGLSHAKFARSFSIFALVKVQLIAVTHFA